MNHQLTQLLHQRAELAQDLDIDRELLEIRERATGLGRRRRNLFAAAGGTLSIAAVTGALLILTPAGTSPSGQASQRRAQAAGPVSPAPFTADTTAATGTHTGATATATNELVVAAPAPASAPLSLGLVPEGYAFIASTDAVTTYGPPSTRHRPDYYLDKLTVLVGERYDHVAGPDTVDGHTGAIVADNARNDGSWSVTIDYSANIQITLQVPGSAALTRPQVQAIADTVDIRNISHPAHG